LKFDRVTGTNPSCFRTEVKGTKKAQEIEEKPEHPLYLLNLNEIFTRNEAMSTFLP
jgi:hypothetical protein